MKHLSISIVLAVLMSMAGEKAFANGVAINRIYYLLAADTATVTYYASDGNNAVAYFGDIVIPETVSYNNKEYRVTWIGDKAFYKCAGITSISLPNGIRGINEYAFYECKSLQSIIVPEGVSVIRRYTFYHCENLSTVKLPSTLWRIEDNAFSCCFSLSTIDLNDELKYIYGAGIFGGCPLNNIVIPKNVKVISGNDSNPYYYDSGSNSYYRTFADVKFDYIIAKSLSIKFSPTINAVFDNAALYHAILYVPIGTWKDAAYGSWWPFHHIQEMAMGAEELSETQAYSLVNLDTSENMYYDNVNGGVSKQSIHQDLNTANLNNYWQIINKDGKQYLYNIGAHMYAFFTEDGKLATSIVPVEVEFINAGTGVTIGSDKSTRWGFVVANGVDVDKDVTGIKGIKTSPSSEFEEFYTLDGKRLSSPQKGVNIIRMSNGTTKKVVIK